MQISMAGLKELDARLADHSLGMQAVRVLVAMAQSIDYETDNRVAMGRKDLERHLGMAASNVSKAINDLIACGFVLRPKWSRAPYRINPRLLWQGSSAALRRALEAA